MFSLYVHIPFCLKKCSYCDFHSTAVEPKDIPQLEYASAVCAELETLIDKYDLHGRKVDTIYFGGGTPSVFEARYLEAILNCIYKKFSVTPDAEITIETNPETLTNSKTHELKNSFNRLSIGIQSFDDHYLKLLGRNHSSKMACNAIRTAKEIGFKNIGIDLIWGLPGQTLEGVRADLKKAISFNVKHISAYQLTLDLSSPRKRGSRLHSRGSRLRWNDMPDEYLSREMWFLVHDFLTSAGYEHYEISNFARHRFRCRHNENYWHYGEWVGVGSGAVSALNNKRFISTKDIKKYLGLDFDYEVENIAPNTAISEYCFMGLRTSDGIELNKFEKRFYRTFDKVYPDVKDLWIKQGLAKLDNNRLALTPQGLVISNELFTQLF